VSGKEHTRFVDKFLKSLLEQKIIDYSNEANAINENIITNLSPHVRRKDVRMKTSTLLTCKSCHQVSKSVKQLHMHMRTKHDRTLTYDTNAKQSTRHNSLVEQLMIEDASLDEENVLYIDDELRVINVESDSALTNDAHKQHQQLITCEHCQFEALSVYQLKYHLESHHVTRDQEPPCIIDIPTSPRVATDNDHEKPVTCDQCDYRTSDNSNLLVHKQLVHMHPVVTI